MPSLSPTLNKPAADKSRRRFSLWPIASAAGVIILLLGWWFFWRPAWQELQSLPDIADYESTKQVAQQELDSLNSMNEEFAQLSATDRQRLDLALPRGQDLPNLLAQLEGIAETTNFIITDIGFSADRETKTAALPGSEVAPVAGATEAKELKINLTIQGGDYAELKKFINTAEASLRLLQLTSLTFATKQASSSGNVYTLNLRTAYLP